MELLDPFGSQNQSCPLSKWAESHAVHSDVTFGDCTWRSTTCKEDRLCFKKRMACAGRMITCNPLILTCIIVTFKS